MGWARHSGTVVSLALLASIIGHYAVHRHFQRESQSKPLVNVLPGLPFESPIDSRDPGNAPRRLEELDLAPAPGEILPALSSIEADDVPSASAPQPVPLPSDAAPLADQDENSKGRDSIAVRIVIEEELKGSSREERDIWYEELKSLPAGVVRDLLQVRKQLRQLPRGLHRVEPAEPLPAPRVAEIPAEPASQIRRQAMSDWTLAANALEQACTIARHNIANATTPGYKRLRITLVDAYSPWQTEASESTGAPLIAVEGCRLAPILLDMDNAVMENTTRPLDLAIRGDGFFVALKHEKLVYTRGGALNLDDQRRICLATDSKALLEPTITVPADAVEIQVTGDGKVLVLRKQAKEFDPVGQLQLARFASPSRLRPAGGTLLVPSEESGAAETGTPGDQNWGLIHQSFLELPNVDVEAELSQIEHWQTLLKSLPQANRSVTAGNHEQRSR